MRYDDWCSLTIHVAMDNNVVIQEISMYYKSSIIFRLFYLTVWIIFQVKLCEKDDSWKPLLLIIPLRLGLSEVNPIYIKGLKKSFEIPGTIGLGIYCKRNEKNRIFVDSN